MKLLLVDDDLHLCEILQYQFKIQHIDVDVCHDGAEALMWISENTHDLIILDRMLPSLDGISVLKKMRQLGYQQPVIMLTALGELSDRVSGLNYGADDYMVKPFDFEELLARIYSILRRPRQWTSTGILSVNDLTLDSNKGQLCCKNKCCTLSHKESQLFEIFLQNPGQVLPRTLLLSRAWETEASAEDGNLDNYIYFLRRRLKAVESSMIIKTVRGIGYLLKEE